MTSAADAIKKLQEESEAKAKEAERLHILQAEFPDLQRRVGRWNKEAFYSKTVNTRVTGYDARHNCGCCNDSPLEVWPYLETPHGKVYSDPPMFVIGERNPYGSGDLARPGWEDQLRKVRIPEALIEKMACLMKVEPEED